MTELRKIYLSEKYQSLWPESPDQILNALINVSYPRYSFITGGRGSGKSFAIALFIAHLIEAEPGQVILYSRKTMVSAYKSIIPEFLEKLQMLGMGNKLTVTKDQIIHENGSIIWFLGLQSANKNDTARLKSIQNLSTWVLDEAEELTDEDIFDQVNYSIRRSNMPNRVIISMNPPSVHHFLYRKFFTERDIEPGHNGIYEDVNYIHTTYLDIVELEQEMGISILDKTFIDEAEKTKETNLLKYKNKFLGEWLKDTENALWNSLMITSAHDKQYDPDDIKKIVVSVDPSVTSTGKQDECGIVVCGKISDSHFVVLEDASGTLSPSEWAKRAIMLYHKYDASEIVAEVNQGGDLVKDNILNANRIGSNKAISVKTVRATKGKIIRAEPIATLYENNAVSHNDNLTELDLELQTYTGDKNQNSPGRLDALVWGLTRLAIKQKKAFIL